MHLPTGEELQSHIKKKHPQDASETFHYRRVQIKPTETKPLDPYIVVDGDNVAYFDSDKPLAKNLKCTYFQVKKLGYTPIMFVSATLRHTIDSTLELVRMINLNWVIETEEGEDEDIFIIKEAQSKNCDIISNNNYKKYIDQYNRDDWSLKSSLRKFKFEDRKLVFM